MGRWQDWLHHGFDIDQVWFDAFVGAQACFADLHAAERTQLRELAGQFVKQKDFVACGGLELKQEMCATIAVYACLPMLHLGVEWWRGWREILLYPEPFVVPVSERDETGVVHDFAAVHSGEAWQQGPLILAWSDVLGAGGGYNVVIHEIAHKLDMLNGAANGFPPLHTRMAREAWTQALSAAYADLCRRSDEGLPSEIDLYAADSPAECFAVFSEYFFELPQRVQQHYPLVWQQLRMFYQCELGK